MASSFQYRIVRGSPHLLPVCDVYVLGRQGRARVTALVDTGAVYCFFPVSAAHDAGIQLPTRSNFEVHYGSGKEPGWLTRAYIEIDRRRWETEIVFVERLDFPYGLLGRRGVFNQFNEVTFTERIASPKVEFRG